MFSQETFQAFMPAVGRLNVDFAAHAFARAKVDRFMSDAQSRRAGRIACAAIGDQKRVAVEQRAQSVFKTGCTQVLQNCTLCRP